jgi:hypothetical protein
VQQKILATLTAIVGGLAAIYALLTASGIEMSQDLQDSLTGVAGLALIVFGIWLHPSVPVGDTSVNNDAVPPDSGQNM